LNTFEYLFSGALGYNGGYIELECNNSRSRIMLHWSWNNPISELKRRSAKYTSQRLEFRDYPIPATQLVQVGPRMFNTFQEYRKKSEKNVF